MHRWIIIRVDDFAEGTIDHAVPEQRLPGGKGINVSIVLACLDHENAALGFVGGFTGRKIEARLKPIGCAWSLFMSGAGIPGSISR